MSATNEIAEKIATERGGQSERSDMRTIEIFLTALQRARSMQVDHWMRILKRSEHAKGRIAIVSSAIKYSSQYNTSFQQLKPGYRLLINF